MYNVANSNPTLDNCIFSGNSAGNAGGGMWNLDQSNPTLTNCTFSSNSATDGGGMANWDSSPTLNNCVFRGNLSDNHGGGNANADFIFGEPTNLGPPVNSSARLTSVMSYSMLTENLRTAIVGVANKQ
jgi:parallel beta-helix repeat protein